MTDIAEITRFLAEILIEGEGNENLSELFRIHSLSFPLAFAIENEYVDSLTPKAIAQLEHFYSYLESVAKERGIEDVEDLAWTHTPIIPLKMGITIPTVEEK
jgi:hypothetical protein